jgi:hypothetical protein
MTNVCDNFLFALYVEIISHDRLCGLVVRVSGYRSTDPGFSSWRYQVS